MITAQSYISEIKARLAASPIIATLNIVTERTIKDRGYFRARMSLINGDFLEVSEYFVVEDAQPSTIEYRYQWMDRDQRHLIKRWDNAEHYPDLPDFPHHIHVGSDQQVVPGRSLNIIDLIGFIERDVGK